MNGRITYLYRSIVRMNPKKLFNLVKIQFDKIITKPDISNGLPVILIFDPSSICNLHCPLCPTGQGRKERSKGVAKFESFKNIFDEIKDYLLFTQFTNWGEPIVAKDLARMIKYAHDNNTETILRTNLTLANKETCEELVMSGLDEIIISLDGATEETYLEYRKGGNFKKVLENIGYLSQFKHSSRSKIRIIWQYLVSSKNETEIALAKKMAKELGIILRLSPLRVDMGKEVTADRQDQIKKDFSWLPKNQNLSRYNYRKKQNRYFEKNCRWLWTKIVVNWNGSVSPCCAIWEEKYDFGNAYSNGISSIWNNNKYQLARKTIREKKANKDIICSKCLKNGFVN